MFVKTWIRLREIQFITILFQRGITIYIRMARIYNFPSSTVTTERASILFGQRTIIMEVINRNIINKYCFCAVHVQSLVHLTEKHVHRGWQFVHYSISFTDIYE